MKQTTSQENDERPVFVKSTNYRHSTTMKFPDDPPTDKQVRYGRNLVSALVYQVKNGKHEDLDKSILSFEVPKTRKEMSDLIGQLLALIEDGRN